MTLERFDGLVTFIPWLRGSTRPGTQVSKAPLGSPPVVIVSIRLMAWQLGVGGSLKRTEDLVDFASHIPSDHLTAAGS
ncbi:hypothetical protein BSP239C_02371 [Brevibacterium sp. 239c]|nr:hypothetical protein BSP239C_02371 [Brevibacterium sp. 239c]